MTTVRSAATLLHWWSAEPERVSDTAAAALEAADEPTVSSITRFELAWLARHGRVVVDIPVRSSLEGLAADVRSIAITPAIAEIAVSLPASFRGDPADRLIHATAIEHGWRVVTKDDRMRRHRAPRPMTIC